MLFANWRENFKTRMAAKITICRFSSQDPLHRTDNILSKGKKWLCHKDDKSGRLEAELHLPQSIKIGFINLGNCGSAFVEILVGRSMWPAGKDYVTLLPSTMLMLPAESKTAGKKNEEVKMFDQDSFVQGVTDGDWDRLRVILRQPYTKNKQFGLRFLDIIPNNETSQVPAKSKTSPKQSLAAFRSKLDAISSPSSSRSQPRHPPSKVHLTSPTSSRATGLVQAALKGHVKPRQQDKTHQRHKVKRNSPYQVQGNVDAQLQRRKSASRRTAGDIEDEVECFLESFDFNKLPLESITYRHLKESMEAMRGMKLSKEEKKIFLKLAKQHVLDLEKPAEEKVLGPVEVKSTDDEDESVCKTSPPVQFPVSPTPPSQSPATSPLKSPTQLSGLNTSSLHECPLCEIFFPRETIEFHASTCVGDTTRGTIVLTSPTRESDSDEVEIQLQVHSPVKTAYDVGSSETVPCPFCRCWFPRSRINVHANVCVESGPLMSF